MAIAGLTLAISSTSFDAGGLTRAHAFVYDDRSAVEADIFSSFKGGTADLGIPELRATPRAPRYGYDHRANLANTNTPSVSGFFAPQTVAGAADDVGARGFSSFRAFKAAEGRAASGYEWHHIVEQRPGNIAKFGSEAIHSTENLLQVEAGVHRQISGFYSSKQFFSDGLRVREWLSNQSFEQQFTFGQRILRQFGVIE